MSVVIDSEVTINGNHPVQGSVSLSLDESGIVVAKYEGGAVAGVKGRVKCSLKASFYGAGGDGVSTGQTVTMSVTGSTFTLTDCIVIKTTGWNTDTGFITDWSVTGYGSAET